MRKDIEHRKNLGVVYAVYNLYGLNQDRFINLISKKGVLMGNVKKVSPKQCAFCVNIKQNKKFFAIIDKLWYNGKKCSIEDGQKLVLGGGYILERVKTSGVCAPIYKLVKNTSLLIGAILFCLIAVLSGDVVFSIDYLGSGIEQIAQVNHYLVEQGVGRFSRFSQIDLNVLADGILARQNDLSFVNCYKRGNRLIIELHKAENPPSLLEQSTKLVSDVDGVIEQIKVYRGTSMVNVGDTIKKGDLLVDGTILIKEQTVQVNVLATVVISTEHVVEYTHLETGKEKEALIFAEQQYSQEEITRSDVTVTPLNERFIYTVTLRCKKVFIAG